MDQTMRLRPRRSLDGVQAVDKSTRKNDRVLGDISNRANSNHPNKKHSKNKSSKSTKIHFDESSVKKPKSRRSSARLQEKTNHAKEHQPLKSVQSSKQNESNTKKQKRRRSKDFSPKNRKKARSTEQEIKPIVLDQFIRADEDQYFIHPDFRLKRTSFDGINNTLGMSKHDRENKDDVLQVAPYVADMFQHHYALEGKTRPRLYMHEQSDVNAKMRAILVDWLVEVHMKFRLVPETLFLCINIIDRYCSLVKVQRSKLQLVGVTALLIACKYEEIYPPEVRDCVYITDSAYEREEVLDMEQDIVHQLSFRITVPTAYPFLQRFLKLLKAPAMVKHAASYYTERTLQEHDMLRFRPSLICASAIVLAINNPEIDFDEGAEENNSYSGTSNVYMPSLLLEYTGFTKLEIIECATKIAQHVEVETVTASRRQLVAVKRKYDNKKYLNVSTEIELPEIPSLSPTIQWDNKSDG